jgi:hypothetical protein
MITFKIVEKKENDLDTLIEKGNLTTQFTLRDVVEHLAFTEKTLKQTKAQIEAEDIQNTMAEEVFPMLKDIPEDKWNLVLMYANRKVQRPLSVSLVEASEQTIKSYTEQLETIKNELGLSTEEKVEEAPLEEAKEEVVVE